MADFQFTLRSGRRLGVNTFGSPTALHVLVLCHPAPGSGAFDPEPRITADGGVHMLAFDRPGYGASDPLLPGEEPSIQQVVADIGEYIVSGEFNAQAVGVQQLDSFGVAGWSAGGRVALGLAAAYPHLVHRAVAVATPAPQDAVPWIPQPFLEMIARLGAMPVDAAIASLSESLAEVTPMPSADPEEHLPLDQLGITAADASALDGPGVRNRLDGMLREAYRQGTVGAATDILGYTTRPWGIDFESISAPTMLVYGEDDPQIGSAHAHWYRDAIPDATVETVPGVGHLAIVPAWERIIDFLTKGRASEQAAPRQRAESERSTQS